MTIARLLLLLLWLPGLMAAGVVSWLLAEVAVGVLWSRPPDPRPRLVAQPSVARDTDQAWGRYYAAQAAEDLRTILREAVTRWRRLPGQAYRPIDELFEESTFWTVVGGLLGAVALAIAVVIGSAAAAMLTVAVGGLLYALIAASWVLSGLLRFADRARRVVLRTSVTCQACAERPPYPAYACPRCGRRHGDIRPGSLGLIRRRCACGELLPTLVLLGSGHLEARCPSCDHLLSERAGTTIEVVVPVYGATDAGKTSLLLAMIEHLCQGEGGRAEPADRRTAALFQERSAELRAGGTRPTSRNPLEPEVYSLYVPLRKDPSRKDPSAPSRRRPAAVWRSLAWRRAGALVHFFDVAGERFNEGDELQGQQHMRLARVVLFVVDLLALRKFWALLTPAERERIGRARPPGVATTSYLHQQLAEGIRRMGVDPGEVRIALVISKLDVLATIGAFAQVRDGRRDPAEWLARWLGLGQVLQSMKVDFAEHKIFMTTALIDGDRVDPSVVAVVRWTLDGAA